MVVLDCTEMLKNKSHTITTLDYVDNIERKHLILSNNNLEIDFLKKINFTGVVMLNISNNAIQELNFNLMPTWSGLTELDVSFNNLSILEVDFVLQFPLEFANLSNNQIAHIKPSYLTGSSFMAKLDLSNNKLINLNISTFKNLVKLVNLNLDFNLIESIEEKTFSGLNSLEILSLTNNRLTNMDFDIPKKLYHLFLGNYQYGKNTTTNSISVFPNETDLCMLKTLDLSHNNFTLIPESLTDTNFPKLEMLDLTGNPFKNSTFPGKMTFKRGLITTTTPSTQTMNVTATIFTNTTTSNTTDSINKTPSTESSISSDNNSSSTTTNEPVLTGSTNSTGPISTELEIASFTMYCIIAAVTIIVIIIALGCCYRRCLLKKRRENRRY